MATTFRGKASNRRSMDRETAEAIKKEKAAQKKVDSRNDPAKEDPAGKR